MIDGTVRQHVHDLDGDPSEIPEELRKLSAVTRPMLQPALDYLASETPCENSHLIDCMVSISMTLAISMIENIFHDNDPEIVELARAHFLARFADGMSKGRS